MISSFLDNLTDNWLLQSYFQDRSAILGIGFKIIGVCCNFETVEITLL